MPFLPPNQQCQSTEGNKQYIVKSIRSWKMCCYCTCYITCTVDMCELCRVYSDILEGWCYFGACPVAVTAQRASVRYWHSRNCWIYCQSGSHNQAWCWSSRVSYRWCIPVLPVLAFHLVLVSIRGDRFPFRVINKFHKCLCYSWGNFHSLIELKHLNSLTF